MNQLKLNMTQEEKFLMKSWI